MQDESSAWVSPILKKILIQHCNADFNPCIQVFHANLNEIITTQFNGSHRALARQVGLGDYAIKNWVIKFERPSFSQLILFCRGLGVEPGDIASKRMDIKLNAIVKNSTQSAIKQRVSRSSVPEEERLLIGQWLIEQLDGPVPLCVGDVAKQRGVSAAYLKYWFPDVCAQIVVRWRVYVKRCSQLQRVKQARYIRFAMKNLFNAGVYPSRRKVSEVIRGSGLVLAKKHHLLAYTKNLSDNF